MLLLTINNIGVAGTVTIGTKINGPSYKILTGPRNTCLGGITAGHSCTLPVEFDPVAVGNHDDVLTLTPSRRRPPSTVYLHGIADLSTGERIQRPALRSGRFFGGLGIDHIQGINVEFDFSRMKWSSQRK